MNNKFFKKTKLIISGIVLVISLVIIGYGVNNVINVKNKHVEPYRIGSTVYGENEGLYADMSVIFIQKFATKSDESNDYYVVVVEYEDRLLPYVIRIKDKTYDKIVKEFKANEEKEVIVKGWLKRLDSDVIKVLKETLDKKQFDSELFDEVSSYNYSTYFSTYYLNETSNPEVEEALIPVYFGGIIAFIDGIVFISALIIHNRIKKQLNKYPDVLNELNSGMFKELTKNIVLTSNYLVSNDNIIPYSDILSSYKIDYRYNGVKTSEMLGIKTKDNKEVKMGMFKKKDWNHLSEIIEEINSKIKK